MDFGARVFQHWISLWLIYRQYCKDYCYLLRDGIHLYFLHVPSWLLFDRYARVIFNENLIKLQMKGLGTISDYLSSVGILHS